MIKLEQKLSKLREKRKGTVEALVKLSVENFGVC